MIFLKHMSIFFINCLFERFLFSFLCYSKGVLYGDGGLISENFIQIQYQYLFITVGHFVWQS